MPVSLISQRLQWSLLLTEDGHFIFPPRILFWKSMMVDSKISSKKFTKKSIKVGYFCLWRHASYKCNTFFQLNSKPKVSGTNTDLSMIWSPTQWNLMVDSCGLVKIMTVTSNQTQLLKVTVPLDWWHQSLFAQMVKLLSPKLPMVQSHVITETIKRVLKHLPILSVSNIQILYLALKNYSSLKYI